LTFYALTFHERRTFDTMTPENRMRDHLAFLYGKEEAERLWSWFQVRLADFRERNPHLREKVPSPGQRLTERDAFLITYGDQIKEPGRHPLQVLADFLETHLQDVISGVHLLPFYPFSSDDGFSVIDYRQVDPRLGDWDDVARFSRNFRLMFDAVINHISRQSAWFQGFLRGEAPYTGYFIAVDPDIDLSQVVRPRALPLLTRVESVDGPRYVWTTFSQDQIDLNYANPQVLLEIIDLLLFYVERGAEVIRLDAIAYLWKEIGAPCIHLPQTHRVVKLFRAVLDAVAPGVILITETNVPHAENISYFGDLLPGPRGTAQYPEGAKDSRGAKYPESAKYSRGAQYPEGAKDSRGAQYPECAKDSRGAQYPEGAKDSRGAKYPEGAKDSRGAKYPEGAKYSRGAKYPEGAKDSRGAQYPEGAKDSRGAQYPEGAKDSRGAKYPEGAKDSRGAQYPEGAKDSRGAQYPEGAKDSRGAKYPESDEAQMVYQFPLAPLVLHAFHTGDARRLTEWAGDLHLSPEGGREIPASATFFNFIASHDGIGVRPAEGLLSPEQMQALVERTLAHSGQVSYKTNTDGSKSVYELNITLYDALNDPKAPQPDVDVRRFLASQVILLSLAGVPGIYVHSLFGSRNCQECLAGTGRARSINREKFRRADLEAELDDPASIHHQVFQGYLHLLRQRRSHPGFHPNAAQRVLSLHQALFALVRDETMLCLVNVSPDSQSIAVDLKVWGLPPVTAWEDLIGGGVYRVQGENLLLTLEGYQALWLRPVQ
jgi:glycosidase